MCLELVGIDDKLGGRRLLTGNLMKLTHLLDLGSSLEDEYSASIHSLDPIFHSVSTADTRS